ncbi:Hemicentin-1 [Camelus dromedarius]|uniref:Hemicentin-1 n=1 Tax=Camelus dromedarius TaxID=9838 RepID=A0A5N4CJ31_CAMDR|nr:Hemicentin-1 [Camelus dromedarius]
MSLARSSEVGPPIITLEPVETIINAGGKVILNCQATGEPHPTITWSRLGHSIPWDERVKVLSNHSLYIAAAKKEDTSEYECVARNLMGSVLVRVPVIVQETETKFNVLLCSSRWIFPVVDLEILQCHLRKRHPKEESSWMVTGQNGAPGKNAQGAVGVATEPGPELATIHQLSMVGGHVKGALWKYSCAASGLAQLMASGPVGPVGVPALCPVEAVSGRGQGTALILFHSTEAARVKGVMSRVIFAIVTLAQLMVTGVLGVAGECAAGLVMEGRCGGTARAITLVPPTEGGLVGAQTPRPRGAALTCVLWMEVGETGIVGAGVLPLVEEVKRLEDDCVTIQCHLKVVAPAQEMLLRYPDAISKHAQSANCGPQRARGSVIGSINDVEFGIAFLNATVTDSPNSDTRIIHARITNVPRSLGPAMRKIVSILNPIYWTTAKEIGEAVNGFTLTNAVFKRETQVEFATGEILRMTHVARGLDSDGALLLDIVVSGYVLQLQSPAEVTVKDYTEDYIQTGPGQLYASSTRLFTIDGISVPYTWNHTVFYDQAQGRMPFLVETLHASSVESDYNQLEETLGFKIHASISKGERSNQCPSGFSLDSFGPFCADEDECAAGNPCSHVCHNAVGTYYCSCPKGLTIAADGRTCQDIDECALGGHICHAGQDCDNTIGSYRCVVRCGIGFRRTSDGLSCRDVNECRQNVCRPDQHCKNTRGGYKCIDLCPNGMTKAENGTCIDIDECKDGTHQCRYNQICENTRGSYRCVCPRGYRSQAVGRPCMDIDECEKRDICQHECKNTFGSYQCICPPGYQLMLNGKTCQDVDECLEQNVRCGPNRVCFNVRGSFQCIDTPCPPDYRRDPVLGFCLKNCPPNDLECALSPYALEYKLVSLPFGIAANQDLIRLVAYTQDGVMHPRTTFLMTNEDQTVPFALRDENLKGVVYTTRPLREPETYRMRVRALSYSANGTVEYQTTFIVYIAVSAYPY